MLYFLLATPSLALAASFAFTTIDVPGTSGTKAHAINQSGQIVGSFDDASGTHGFLKNGPNFITFDVPGASVTDPLGINDAGQIVGRFEDATGLHGFLKNGTSIITFDIPGVVSTEAEGINSFGQIVGTYFLGASGTHGTPHVYFKEDASSTSFSTIDPPGASSAGAGGINSLGQIVGPFSDGSGGVHGFLKDGVSFTTIDVPGVSFTAAHGINDGGQIVGEFRDTVDAPSHGFLKDGASFITFDVPGAVRTEAYGINGQGQIVGLFLDASGGLHGFLATPVCAGVRDMIVSNFNGTPIRAGNFLWFNSVLKVSGLGAIPVTISLRNATVQFTANNTPFNVSVPDADITFDPHATTATTSFNTATERWETTAPSFGLSGNTFLTAEALPIAANLPGGINPVTWSAQFISDTPGVTLQWKWAAAVYTNFTTALNGLGVKPVDDNQASVFKNADHAGTPENFKQSVIGGARGGGGSNFTGSYSGTKTVEPCQ
jgi:uncharacterized membrane protein